MLARVYSSYRYTLATTYTLQYIFAWKTDWNLWNFLRVLVFKQNHKANGLAKFPELLIHSFKVSLVQKTLLDGGSIDRIGCSVIPLCSIVYVSYACVAN